VDYVRLDVLHRRRPPSASEGRPHFGVNITDSEAIAPEMLEEGSDALVSVISNFRNYFLQEF
jgi:hypothetical protein